METIVSLFYNTPTKVIPKFGQTVILQNDSVDILRYAHPAKDVSNLTWMSLANGDYVKFNAPLLFKLESSTFHYPDKVDFPIIQYFGR